MGEHGGEEAVPSRLFAPDFKAETVALCRRSDCSGAQIAKGPTETTVRLWGSQAEGHVGERDGRRDLPPSRCQPMTPGAILTL